METVTLINLSAFNMRRILLMSFICIILFFIPFWNHCLGQSDSIRLLNGNIFPVCTQFSKVPSGKGWSTEEKPLSDKVLQETVQNIVDHGFNLLTIYDYSRNSVEDEQQSRMIEYARAAGMEFSYLSHGFEIFNRDDVPKVSVYSPSYIEEVRKKVQSGILPISEIEEIHSIFPYMDEPFHASPDMFDYSSDAQAEFIKRYGYRMPLSLDSTRSDPKKWLDLLDFQSGIFPDGWRQVYKTIKEMDSRPRIARSTKSEVQGMFPFPEDTIFTASGGIFKCRTFI